MAAPRLTRRELARPSYEVAPDLLGLELVVGRRVGRIVEVEAYDGGNDPASHAFRGRTPRNATMFGRAGHLYVYFTYGMHFCANVVTGADGEGSAVLVRALAPLAGLDEMRELRRAATRAEQLCSGPAKLCQALGIDRSFDGADLLAPGSPIRLRRRSGSRGDPGSSDVGTSVMTAAAPDVVVSTRVGISVARDLPWRWYVANDPNVSRR